MSIFIVLSLLIATMFCLTVCYTIIQDVGWALFLLAIGVSLAVVWSVWTIGEYFL